MQLALFPEMVTATSRRTLLGSSQNLRQAVAEYLPAINELPADEWPRNRLEHYGSGALSTG